MKNEEVNKIIAEYMGWYQKKGTHIQMWFKEVNGTEMSETSACIGNFTNSLDALVPVWKKIANDSSRCVDINAFFSDESCCDFSISYNGWGEQSSDNPTVQISAAHATAKAILALEEK